MIRLKTKNHYDKKKNNNWYLLKKRNVTIIIIELQKFPCTQVPIYIYT